MNVHSTLLITTALFFGNLAIASPPADDLLAGPSIEKEEVTSQDMTDRVLKEQGKSKKVGSRQQSRMWTNAMKVIDLTKDQEIEIQKIIAEYQKINQIFQDTHGEEIRSFREKHNEQRRDVFTTILIGAPKDKAAVSEESKKRMLELMELAPDVTEYQDRAWALLSVDQQNDFKKQYKLKIDEEMKRREERKLKDQPNMDEMRDSEFSSEDLKIKSRDRDSNNPRVNSSDEGSMRRIKFLRRLRDLQKD